MRDIVIIKRFVDEEARRDIAKYDNMRYGAKIPKDGLATRKQCNSFIEGGMDSEWTALSDDIGDIESREEEEGE
jgi:hypothetical protein